MFKSIGLLLVVVALCGCSDTDQAAWDALGKPGKIICYSADKVIYEGESTGKIQTVDNSDGWEFKEKGTGEFIRVSGACVIRN